MERRIETKQDYAYRVLKDRIVTGSLLPGQRIVVNRFAQDLGTSAIPVREALLRLESERLVTIKPHIGAIVSLMTGDMIQKTLESMAVMEGYATRLAYPHAERLMGKLERHNEAMLKAIGSEDWDRYSAANRRFHFTLYEACENEVLVDTITNLWTQLDSYLSVAAFNLIPDRALGSTQEHERMMAMLAAPDTDLLALELLAREHKINTAKRLKAS